MVSNFIATITPTLIHNHSTCTDIPIWDIVTPKRKFQCYRTHRPGYVPLIITGECSYNKFEGLLVCQAQLPLISNRIITVKDGFRVPPQWYGSPGETYRDLRRPTISSLSCSKIDSGVYTEHLMPHALAA